MVLIQNQDKSSGRPNKWDRQGKIIATKPNDQYLIRVDGSGRLTLRNRRFLRKYSLRSATILDPQNSLHQRNRDGYVLAKDNFDRHTPSHSLPTVHGAVADQPLQVAPNVPAIVVLDANPCAQPSTVPTANHDATADGRVGREPSSRVRKLCTVYDAVTGQQVEPALKHVYFS